MKILFFYLHAIFIGYYEVGLNKIYYLIKFKARMKSYVLLAMSIMVSGKSSSIKLSLL